ncbi:DndE family protein [Stutzerimonas nitrititolerans]|uniref:DndE family protein n=1 Tax=Stutzerimonas nitrititolerans TaxID=2482751 RepID=A0AA41WDE8_9GAMM|nr:DndE family protein [Stutzerimonas nitrititolerans]MCO7543262.1 DndE family protein [Stutzerimonas nitrititolerans]
MKAFPHKFKVSSASTDKLRYLKSKTGLTPNILCRFAICNALKDTTGVGNASVSDLNGQEFNSPTLFGEHMDIYELLLRQFMFEHNIEDDPVRCVAALVEIGLHKMGHVRSLKEVVQLAS